MRQLSRRIHDLARDDGFTSFQNEVVQDFYNVLGQGYSKSENEVSLVGRLVEAARGKSYGPISLHGAMLHGTRSYVEFNYLDQPVTKELGDMALIAIATAGSRRLFQRLTIIQNKKTTGKSWSLDREQLFMLKNFPPFSGYRGIFKGQKAVTFRNTSGCLGSYGLLADPGEMLFATAGLISEFARGKASVSPSDISAPRDPSQGSGTLGQLPMSWLNPHLDPEEWFYVLEKYLHRFGPGPASLFESADFLGNVHFARDLYDLTRSWTRLSIGEPTCVDDVVVNHSVDAFTNYLLRSSGLGELATFPPDQLFGDHRFEGNMAILAVHLEVEG